MEEVDAETLVYDLRDHRAYCLNPSAAAVWKLADGTRSEAEIAAALPAPYRQAVDADGVRCALQQLSDAGLLTARVPAPRVSRRDLFRRAGAAAALAPLVGGILVPEAAEAASCLPMGALCQNGSVKNCCSGFACLQVAGTQTFICAPRK